MVSWDVMQHGHKNFRDGTHVCTLCLWEIDIERARSEFRSTCPEYIRLRNQLDEHKGDLDAARCDLEKTKGALAAARVDHKLSKQKVVLLAETLASTRTKYVQQRTAMVHNSRATPSSGGSSGSDTSLVDSMSQYIHQQGIAQFRHLFDQSVSDDHRGQQNDRLLDEEGLRKLLGACHIEFTDESVGELFSMMTVGSGFPLSQAPTREGTSNGDATGTGAMQLSGVETESVEESSGVLKRRKIIASDEDEEEIAPDPSESADMQLPVSTFGWSQFKCALTSQSIVAAILCVSESSTTSRTAIRDFTGSILKPASTNLATVVASGFQRNITHTEFGSLSEQEISRCVQSALPAIIERVKIAQAHAIALMELGRLGSSESLRLRQGVSICGAPITNPPHFVMTMFRSLSRDMTVFDVDRDRTPDQLFKTGVKVVPVLVRVGPAQPLGGGTPRHHVYYPVCTSCPV